MKFKTIALATALTLASTFALAQSTTVVRRLAARWQHVNSIGPTGKPSGDVAMQKNMGTTGTARQGTDASEQGAGTVASVGATGN